MSLWLLTAAFVALIGQRRKLGQVEMAILTIVLAQVATARWSMMLDDDAADRDRRAQNRQEQREENRDYRDSVRFERQSQLSDQRNLDLVIEGLAHNQRATRSNVAVLEQELKLLDRGLISLAPIIPLSIDWWIVAVERRPSAISERHALMDSLRYIHDSTVQTMARLADRANHLSTEGQLRAVRDGEANPFIRRQRIFALNALADSKELARLLDNFEKHFVSDTLKRSVVHSSSGSGRTLETPRPIEPEDTQTRMASYLTTFLAVWGAILSTVALTWNFIRDLRDRGKLEISAMIGEVVPSNDPRSYLVVTITNVGRRPVFVKAWAGRFKKAVNGKREFIITARHLPKMLNECDFVHEMSDDLQAAANLDQLYVWDSKGKKWHASKSNLAKVAADAKSALERIAEDY